MNTTYLGYNSDEEVRKKSSSGGLFYELAISILNSSGVVYGAGFNENFQVEHIRVTEENQLEKLLCSKYVQSKMNNAYSMVAEDLKKSRTVLFSGTPCQVSGLKKLLKNKNISTLSELITQAQKNGIKFIACNMSMDVMGIKKEELLEGVEIGGVAKYISESNNANSNLFI